MKNLIILFAVITVTSCSKERFESDVTFKFIDLHTNLPVPDLQVDLHSYMQNILTGSTYYLVEDIYTTDENGEIIIEQDRQYRKWSYKIESPFYENTYDGNIVFQEKSRLEVIDVMPLAKVEVKIYDDNSTNYDEVRIFSVDVKSSEKAIWLKNDESAFIPVPFYESSELRLTFYEKGASEVTKSIFVTYSPNEENSLEIGL